MIIHSVAQGTTPWLQLRAGRPTASMFDNIVTPSGNKSESRHKYMQHLLAERILRQPIEGFKSKAMELGNEYESRAIAAYELANDCETYQVGFVTTDNGLAGCSPDRFIVDQPDGMVEAKAPNQPSIHVSYLLAAAGASKEYKVQLQSELWVCEKQFVDIISYHAGFPDAIFRVNRDEDFIGKLAKAIKEFAEELEALSATCRERGWIKDPEPPSDPEPDNTFLTADDIQFALDRFKTEAVAA